MTRYVATVNVPGYMPMDDDPPVFDSAREAWEWLAEIRERDEDAAYNPGDDDTFTDTVAELRSADGLGTVYGETPGYDGDHDLGLAYSVDVAEEEEGEVTTV